MKLRAIAAVFTLAIIVAACAGPNAELVAALKSASVSEVVVEVPPGMGQGLVADMNGVSDKDKAPIVAEAVRQALIQKCMGQPGGGINARLRVTITGLDAGSTAGRVLGSGSNMSGTARLENIQTGTLIALIGEVRGVDSAVQGQGTGGLVAALIVNSITAATQDRIAVLSNSFAEDVRRKLVP